jgi:hypothetical protein
LHPIGLGHHQPVGDSRLLDRFEVRVERTSAEFAVDRGHDTIQSIQGRKHRLGNQGLKDGRGVGQAGGFDHDALERRHLFTHAPGVQVIQLLRKIAAQRAAQAATVKEHNGLAGRIEQLMIERNLAELVDQNRGVGQCSLPQQTRQQRRLAAAQITGQQRDWNRSHHRLSERLFASGTAC